MLKILGRKTSSNVMEVLWLCGELGIEYDREDVGGPFAGVGEEASRLALSIHLPHLAVLHKHLTQAVLTLDLVP